jgi:4-amino-4-deoxy-L-arabinose transferase-like glycosyltransferase
LKGTQISTEPLSTRGESSRTRYVWIAVVVIVALGLAIRLAGVTWGLPQKLHPDEHVIVRGALDLARRHSFEPSMYFRPDHVEIQLSFLAYTFFSKAILHTTVLAGYELHPGTYLLISRLITVAFGTAIIVLAWFIGRIINRRVGLLAAGIAAIIPIFVGQSHYATPDIPLTAAFFGATLALCHYVRSPRIPSLLFASACVSISIAIKYPGAIATVAIAIVVVVVALRDRLPIRILWHGVIAIGAVVVFLFFISPVLFTNYPAVVASVKSESGGHTGADGLSSFGNFLYYGGVIGGVFGILMVAAILLGIFDAVQRRRLVTLPWVLGLITWILLSMVQVHWERWGVPMFVTPLLFGALGLSRAMTIASKWRARRGLKISAISIVTILVLGNFVLPSLAFDARLVAQDTRIAAQSRFAELGITRENAIYEGYTPLGTSLVRSIFKKFTYSTDGRLVPVDAGKRWVVISSCMYARYGDAEAYPTQHKFYSAMKRSFSLKFSQDARKPAIASRSLFEPVNMASAVQDIVAYSSGAQSGCDLRAYQL